MPRREVGSTLLLKGLEAKMANVLHGRPRHAQSTCRVTRLDSRSALQQASGSSSTGLCKAFNKSVDDRPQARDGVYRMVEPAQPVNLELGGVTADLRHRPAMRPVLKPKTNAAITITVISSVPIVLPPPHLSLNTPQSSRNILDFLGILKWSSMAPIVERQSKPKVDFIR
jgi:hypothetical protein